MFVHIGNNYLLKKSDIIAAFNIQSLLEDPKGKKFVNDVRQSGKLVDISEGKQASLILTADGPIYISRISTATLKSRSGNDIENMLVSERRPAPKKAKKKDKKKPA